MANEPTNEASNPTSQATSCGSYPATVCSAFLWDFVEPGWWTHDLLGGVVREASNRWGCYPLDLRDDSPTHIAPSMKEAMRWIEERYLQNPSRLGAAHLVRGTQHGVVGRSESKGE